VYPTALNKLILGLAVLVAAVGAVDAALARAHDLVIVFCLIAVLQLVLLLRLHSRRPAIPIRGDLARWLARRAAAAGEPVGAVADRCLAASRADLDRS
jgi:hypothetical protein